MNPMYFHKVCYFILYDEGELTFFNKYEHDITCKSKIIEKICSLPKDLSELFYDKEHLISNRMSGLFDGYNVKFISNNKHINDSPFDINVVFISSLTNITDIKLNVIFVSETLDTDKSINLYNIKEINKAKLIELISNLISSLGEEKIKTFKELKSLTYKAEKSEYINFDDEYIKSIYTTSNLFVLRSIKNEYCFEKLDVEFNQEHQTPPINRIMFIKSHILDKLPPPIILPRIDFFISDMSSNLEFLVNKNEYSVNALASRGFDDGKLLFNAIKLINQNKTPDFGEDNDYYTIYIKEREFIESIIAIRSAGDVAVNIKLPLCNSLFFSRLKDIGVVDRGNNRSKINKLLSNLVGEFKNSTNELYRCLNRQFSSNIKLVSNLPIEWSQHDGLPLMVRHEVSRIPVSPGNLTTSLLLDSEQIFLIKENFKKVMIISSFKDSDPIKEDLKRKVEYINQQLKPNEDFMKKLLASNSITKEVEVNMDDLDDSLDITIDWINVDNLEGLIKALDNNDSAITIFDLHGSHDVNGNGLLHLKEEIVSVYDIANKVNVSPIVILSSCDTNPIDRNHHTIANAFFLAGAKTVLASALPIQSHEASIFIARLLLRIKYYLPKHLSLDNGRSIRWSSFVTGMTRKTFYSELISNLKNKLQVSDETSSKLNFISGLNLDPLNPNWHENILLEMSNNLNISVDYLKKFIDEDFMMPECLKYIQLGNPELIVIATSSHIPLVYNQ